MTACALSVPAPAAAQEITLRPYQQHDLEELTTLIRSGIRRILLVQPTGAGKGTLATYMIRNAMRKRKRVLFLVNRRTLVHDMSRRLDKLGLPHGIIMGSDTRRRPWLSVHVASIDTLHRRENLPHADLLFADECHFAISPTWHKVVERYEGVPLIGMTATPIRLDGQGLGTMFQALVLGPTVAELTALGYLVPTRVFAPTKPNLSAVKTTAGDYNQRELARVMDRQTLTGDIVAHWERLGRGRPTVCFAVDKDHSKHITERFLAAGHRWKHVDADTPDAERDQTWDALVSGRLAGVSSVGIISYGWDVPPVSCAILARPTQSLALHLQQCGRILRPASGKEDGLILDHAGNSMLHGFVEDEREWSLEGAQKRGSTRDYSALAVRTCRKCWFCFRSSLDKCPECGTPYVATRREILEERGELQEVQRAEKVKAVERWKSRTGDDVRRRYYDDWCAVARERGYKQNWPDVRYYHVFGKWPPAEWQRARVQG